MSTRVEVQNFHVYRIVINEFSTPLLNDFYVYKCCENLMQQSQKTKCFPTLVISTATFRTNVRGTLYY